MGKKRYYYNSWRCEIIFYPEISLTSQRWSVSLYWGSFIVEFVQLRGWVLWNDVSSSSWEWCIFAWVAKVLICVFRLTTEQPRSLPVCHFSNSLRLSRKVERKPTAVISAHSISFHFQVVPRGFFHAFSDVFVIRISSEISWLQPKPSQWTWLWLNFSTRDLKVYFCPILQTEKGQQYP